MKYFEDFTLSLKSSGTPLCVPKPGLGITDLDPVSSLQHLEGPMHDKKNRAGSLLFFDDASSPWRFFNSASS